MVSRRERFVESSNSNHHLQLTKWSCSTSCVISQSVNFSPIFVIQFRTNKTPAEQCRAAGYIHLLATSPHLPPILHNFTPTTGNTHRMDTGIHIQENQRNNLQELSIYELRCHVVMIFRALVSSDLVRVGRDGGAVRGWTWCSVRVCTGWSGVIVGLSRYLLSTFY